MNYHSLVLDLIETYPDQARFDCPSCRRQKSLSVYRNDGELSYFCFGASCNVKGRQKQKLTIEDIYARRTVREDKERAFETPEFFVSGLNREGVRKYLQEVHCFQAAVEGRVQIKYDPKLDRCVFLIYDENNVLRNAVGRALTKGDPRKWHVYGSERYPLVVGKKDICCIVEDAPSAARISHLVTGLALLGTDLSNNYINKLKRYKRVYVSLDKDAQRKAIKMAQELEYFADVSIMLLDEDFKNLDEAHLMEFLGERVDLENIGDL